MMDIDAGVVPIDQISFTNGASDKRMIEDLCGASLNTFMPAGTYVRDDGTTVQA